MRPKNFRPSPGAPSPRQPGKSMFKEFDATELYCPRCQRPVPVRKRLLLVLPEGEKYEYRCAYCAESIGHKIARDQQPIKILI